MRILGLSLWLGALVLLLPSLSHAVNFTVWRAGTATTSDECKNPLKNGRCFWFFDVLTLGEESPVLKLDGDSRCSVKFRGTSGTVHPYYCDDPENVGVSDCDRAHYWNGATGAFEDVELTQTSRKLDYYGERTLLVDPVAGTGIVVIECGGR